MMVEVRPAERTAASTTADRLLNARPALLFIAVAGAYQSFCAFQPVSFLNAHVLMWDDAYYYFQVAQNFVRLGWPTFDGIHATSGIQLAWGMMLTPVAWAFPGRLEFLQAVLVLTVMLNVAAGMLLWHLGCRMHSARLGTAAAAIWSGFMLALNPTMLGCEYSLHVVVLLLIIGLWWDVLRQPDSVSTGRLVILGSMLAVNYWVRLDAAVLSALVALSAIHAIHGARPTSRAFVAQVTAIGLPMAIGAGAYVLTCLGLAGTPFPISGIVKRYYAAEHFREAGLIASAAGHLLWWVEIQVQAIKALVAAVLPIFIEVPERSVQIALPLALALGASVWAVRSLTSSPSVSPATPRLVRFLALMACFAAVHSAVVVATIGHFSHVRQHYYAWSYLTCFLWGALIVQLLWSAAAGRVRHTVAIAVGLIIVLHASVALRRFDPGSGEDQLNRRLPAITWINEHLEPGVRVGAWNAGQVGYYCDCVVINLDGLVNDAAFLDRVRRGAPIEEYLRNEGIRYLIDFDESNLTQPYRTTWDRSRLFRNLVPWADLELLHSEPSRSGLPEETIVVVRVRGITD